MRVLAATGEKRTRMPDVPTVKEAGVLGYVEGNWQAVLVPGEDATPSRQPTQPGARAHS
jgi:tripartite-type tricarboxylate transporter receptor subunit TctC